jgi:hypothetical protein
MSRARKPTRKKPASVTKHLVFITHSSLDAGIAALLAEKVSDCGAEYFLDVDHIAAGDNFNETIRTNLLRAKELVVLMTPWASKSSYIWSEVGAAWVRKIRIVLILQGISLNDLRALPGFPSYLQELHFIDNQNLNKYLSELKGRCPKGTKRRK